MTAVETIRDGEAADDLGSRPTEWLEAEITTLAGHIAAATCRWLILVAEYDRREGHQRWESLTCAHWLTWKCGMSLRTAREHVRVARALEHLPVTTSAFAAGQLSYSKVRAITRVATPKTERDLVDVARNGTATHVDRIVAGHRTVTRSVDPDRAGAQLRRRGVWLQTDDDGTTILTVRGGPDAIAAILRVADAAASALPELVDEPEARGAARRFDGLEQIAHTYLEPDGHVTSPTELVVHADLETLTEREPGRAEIEPRFALTAATLERLACECGVRLTTEANGDTLDVGRRSRTPSTASHAPSATATGPGAASRVAPTKGTCRSTTATIGRGWTDREAQPVPRVPLPPPRAPRGRLACRGRRRWIAELHRSHRTDGARSRADTDLRPTPHRARARGARRGDHRCHHRAARLPG